MQKWEYYCHTHFFRKDRDRTDGDIQILLDSLDHYGAKGWELVTIVPHSHSVLDAVFEPHRKIPLDSYWKRHIEE